MYMHAQDVFMEQRSFAPLAATVLETDHRRHEERSSKEVAYPRRPAYHRGRVRKGRRGKIDHCRLADDVNLYMYYIAHAQLDYLVLVVNLALGLSSLDNVSFSVLLTCCSDLLYHILSK